MAQDRKPFKTDLVRFSYANVFVPTAMEEGKDKTYNISMLWPKTNKAFTARVEAEIKKTYVEGKAAFGGAYPAKWWNPLRDGDEEKPGNEEYAGMMFLGAKSKNKPQIIDKKGVTIDDAEDFYSGCYGKASLNFYAFGAKVPLKGVAAGLNSLLKVEDGERLSGGAAPAATDFADDLDNDSLM